MRDRGIRPISTLTNFGALAGLPPTVTETLVWPAVSLRWNEVQPVVLAQAGHGREKIADGPVGSLIGVVDFKVRSAGFAPCTVASLASFVVSNS